MSNSISQLKELSNEELRCRVAEELGWIYPGSTRLKHEQWRRWIPPKGSSTRTVPKYLESLDAIAEAEKTLSDEEFYGDYCTNLWFICGDPGLKRIRASARQRAIAFLAVRGREG